MTEPTDKRERERERERERREQIRRETERASWTPREFAARHGVSHPVIYAEIKAGRLGFMELGKRCKRITLVHEAEWQRLVDSERERGAA